MLLKGEIRRDLILLLLSFVGVLATEDKLMENVCEIKISPLTLILTRRKMARNAIYA